MVLDDLAHVDDTAVADEVLQKGHYCSGDDFLWTAFDLLLPGFPVCVERAGMVGAPVDGVLWVLIRILWQQKLFSI